MRTTHSFATAVVFLVAVVTPAWASGDDLAWLGGRWCGGTGDERVEEVWLDSTGGQLLGLSRTTKNGQLASFEFLRIGEFDGVATYFAQPGGRPPTGFSRSAVGEAWGRFENRAHDFPQRIEYRREGDVLHVEVAGPGEGGKEMVMGFDYTRCGD